jgi:hypothetical protein
MRALPIEKGIFLQQLDIIFFKEDPMLPRTSFNFALTFCKVTFN